VTFYDPRDEWDGDILPGPVLPREAPVKEHPGTISWRLYKFPRAGIHVVVLPGGLISSDMMKRHLIGDEVMAVCCVATGMAHETDEETDCEPCWSFLRTLKMLQDG